MAQRTITGFLISVSIISIAVSVTIAQQITTEEAVKRICGTWLNTSYSGDRTFPQKIVFKADKTFETYNSAPQESPSEKGDFNIIEGWTDVAGCTYCKATTKSLYSASSSFELWRLDSLGNKWESRFSFSMNTFATEISPLPDSSRIFYYSIYSRQPNTITPPLKDSIVVGDYTQYIYTAVGGKPLKAYVFQPKQTRDTSPRSAIALFHGGGWAVGDPEWAFSLARHFASLGMVAVAIQYRLSDQLSITPLEAMADVRAAIRWMRSKAPVLRIDTDRIAAYGWSAGAHLAVSAAIFNDAGAPSNTNASPNALILISPGVYLESDTWVQTLLGTRADASSVSPASHIRSGLLPTLVLQGRHDTVVPLNGVQLFSDRMRAAGNRCDLHIYEGVGHMFTPDSISDAGWPRPDPNVQADALKRADSFLVSLGFIR
jgi:acetyl esterase